jgi:hypothetical protein
MGGRTCFAGPLADIFGDRGSLSMLMWYMEEGRTRKLDAYREERKGVEASIFVRMHF